MTNIQQAMIDLQTSISCKDYFVDLYFLCLDSNSMTAEGIHESEYSDAQIINFCNEFWNALPDDPSIRRQPFFALCNIAENCFDEEEQ